MYNVILTDNIRHMNQNETQKRYDEFGFLKLFMAFGIATCHYNILISNPVNLVKGGGLLSGLLRVALQTGAMYGGNLPICFFVLSGYVMMKGYYNIIKQKEITFKQFFVRRLARNLPLLWFSVIVMAMAQWVWLYLFSEYWTGRSASLWNILVSLTGLSVGTVVDTLDTLNGPIWYVSVLLVCYVIYWFLTDKMKNKSGVGHSMLLYSIPIVAGLSAVSYSINLPFLNSNVSTGYVGFFWGVEMYFILDEKFRWRRAFVVFEAMGFSLIILVLLFFRERANYILGDTSLWMAFLLIPFPIVFINRFRSSRLINNRFNNMMGRFSYALFLLHVPSFVCASLIVHFLNIDAAGIEMFYWIVLICISVSLIWILAEKKIRVHTDKLFLPEGDV